MTVGIDLRIFQIGHQYRGIGAHITNLMREFSEMKELPSFVFFEHPNVESGLGVIEEYLPKFKYEIRHTNNRLVGETFFEREWTSFKQRYFSGDAGLGNLDDVDVLLSVDFNLGVPRKSKVNTVLISYDMIPWVLSEYYLPGFKQSYKELKNIKRSIKAEIEKRLYFNKFKQANKRADKILSISEHTKKDIVKILKINPKKITTVVLGISKNSNKKLKPRISTIDANGTNNNFNSGNTKYIFFMGGADRRRRIEDLISSFNQLAKNDKDIHVILSGYDFQRFDMIPDPIVKNSISNSKHKDRILFAGFISEPQRNSLFSDAIAFIFPSTYEGFGLPILESMDMNCPVITYKNSSIVEVGGDAVLYANNAQSITLGVKRLLNNGDNRKKLLAKGRKQLRKFSWNNTATETMSILKSYK